MQKLMTQSLPGQSISAGKVHSLMLKSTFMSPSTSTIATQNLFFLTCQTHNLLQLHRDIKTVLMQSELLVAFLF